MEKEGREFKPKHVGGRGVIRPRTKLVELALEEQLTLLLLWIKFSPGLDFHAGIVGNSQ